MSDEKMAYIGFAIACNVIYNIITQFKAGTNYGTFFDVS